MALFNIHIQYTPIHALSGETEEWGDFNFLSSQRTSAMRPVRPMPDTECWNAGMVEKTSKYRETFLYPLCEQGGKW